MSRQEYDQSRAALDSAKALLEAAEAQARVSNNSSEYAVLLADADGVIVRTLSEPGQVVAAGQTLIHLAHDGPREASINLPEGVRPDLGTMASARLYGRDQVYHARLRELRHAQGCKCAFTIRTPSRSSRRAYGRSRRAPLTLDSGHEWQLGNKKALNHGSSVPVQVNR